MTAVLPRSSAKAKAPFRIATRMARFGFVRYARSAGGENAATAVSRLKASSRSKGKKGRKPRLVVRS